MSVRAALRRLFSRKTIGKDAVSGLVLGIEAVPDGLAAGLLAGINPLAGLYASGALGWGDATDALWRWGMKR